MPTNMLANPNQLITQLRNLPVKRLRSIMFAMALIVAGAQLAMVVHHSTELQPEPPGHVCPICLVGSGVVGLHASPIILAVPPALGLGTIVPQPDSFHSFDSHFFRARDPPL